MSPSTFKCITILLTDRWSLSFIYLSSWTEIMVADFHQLQQHRCGIPSLPFLAKQPLSLSRCSRNWKNVVQHLCLAYLEEQICITPILSLDWIKHQMWNYRSGWFIKRRVLFYFFFLVIRTLTRFWFIFLKKYSISITMVIFYFSLLWSSKKSEFSSYFKMQNFIGCNY